MAFMFEELLTEEFAAEAFASVLSFKVVEVRYNGMVWILLI